MAYNPSQPRISGKFSGPGTGQQAAPAARPTPDALKQAKAILAQRSVQAKAQARLTPAQRQSQREHDLALRIMAAQKRIALAKVRRTQMALRRAAAARAHAASSRASAIAAGTAAGQRASRTALAAPAPGQVSGPSSQVQANLRRYLTGH